MLDILYSSKGSFSVSINGNADHEVHYKLGVKEFNFAKTTFNNLISETTYGPNSRIGSELLKYGRLTLDYKRKKYSFQPYLQSDSVDVNHKVYKFSPIIENNKFVVGIIWDSELKERMKVGDEILKINNTDFTKLSYCEIIRMSFDNFSDSNDKITVTLKDIDTHEIKVAEILNSIE